MYSSAHVLAVIFNWNLREYTNTRIHKHNLKHQFSKFIYNQRIQTLG